MQLIACVYARVLPQVFLIMFVCYVPVYARAQTNVLILDGYSMKELLLKELVKLLPAIKFAFP